MVSVPTQVFGIATICEKSAAGGNRQASFRKRNEFRNGTERPLARSGAPLGFDARFGVDIGFLSFDAPVAELVERDSRAGHRAHDVVTVTEDAEGAR